MESEKKENLSSEFSENEIDASQSLNIPKDKSEYLNEWIQKADFDEASSIVTDSINDDNLTDCSSSIVDSENLSEYMANVKIENNISVSLKREEIIQKATNSIYDMLHTENSTTQSHGNITIQNSKNVHVGNITYIAGPIQIVQNVEDNRKSKNKSQNKEDYLIGNIERVIDDSSLTFIDRRTWLAQSPMANYEYIDGPVQYVIIAHTATELSLTQADSIFIVRNIQNYHIESMHYDDIGYNFLIGGEGNIYEGRNWGVVGCHTKGWNRRSVGIAFIGCFMKELPTKISLNACKLLIQKGVELGHIRPDYKLLGHCQCLPFQSPGKKLFDEIKTWPNFLETS